MSLHLPSPKKSSKASKMVQSALCCLPKTTDIVSADTELFLPKYIMIQSRSPLLWTGEQLHPPVEQALLLQLTPTCWTSPLVPVLREVCNNKRQITHLPVEQVFKLLLGGELSQIGHKQGGAGRVTGVGRHGHPRALGGRLLDL